MGRESNLFPTRLHHGLPTGLAATNKDLIVRSQPVSRTIMFLVRE
jgi:hypothetical protein